MDTGQKRRASGAGPSLAEARLIFDSLPLGIVWLDAQGKISFANPAAEEILGLTVEQMRGVTSVDPRWRATREDGRPFPGEEHPSMVALRTRQPISGVVMGVHNPQRQAQTWIRIDAVPVDGDAGGLSGVYTVFRDITEKKQADAELERMRRLQAEGERLAGLGVWENEVATGETVWSEGLHRIYGLDPPQKSPNYSQLLRERVHPDDAEELDRKFQEALARQAILESSHRIVKTDGTVRHVRSRAHPYFNADGTLARYVGITVDVTDSVRQQQELRSSEQRWKFALEGAEQGVWDWDMVQGTVYYSTRYAQMLGFTREELGDSYEAGFARIHPEDLPALESAVDEHVRGRTPHYRCEFRIRCKDGHWIWVESRGMVTERRTGGEPARMIGTHVDISARKAQRQALERSEEQLRLAADGAQIGTWYRPMPGQKVELSDCCKALLGRAGQTDWTVNDCLAAVHPADRDRMRQVIDDALERRGDYAAEYRVVHPDGRVRWISAPGHVYSNEDGTPARWGASFKTSPIAISASRSCSGPRKRRKRPTWPRARSLQT